MVVLTAAAAKVRAIDTPHRGSGPDSLEQQCRTARRDGFRAKLTADPAELLVIHAVFGAAG